MPYLPCIESELHCSADRPANAAVIWLHGLGASGDDFAPIVPELQLPTELPIRFVFPHAPQIPVTINGGFVMPAWYDILEMNIDRKIDEQQILASAASISALIDREIERGIDSQRIVLAGFSQGGAVAYQTALTYPKPLAGLLAMSTYFATSATIEPSDANRTLAIEIQHGSQDGVVPEALGERALGSLVKMGHSPTYKSYPMEHQVCFEQIKDIANWLQGVLRERSL